MKLTSLRAKKKGAGLLLFILLANSHAQEGQISEGPVPQLLDQKDQAQAKRLSRQELQKLNAKLREAMALYYNRSYRLALPILEEIAARIDTMDVLYWLGRAAYESGRPELAIAKFKTMLERNPDLPQVRLELALAYLKAGDTVAARAELQKVLATTPPEALRQQIEQVVARIDLSEKRFFASVFASIGPQYDTNINVGPIDEQITLPGGGILTAKTLEGWMIQYNVSGDAVYDFGAQDGFVLHNYVDFLHNGYLGSPDDEFNYTQIDVGTALEYYGLEGRAQLPFGFMDRRFSNEDLSHVFYLAPNISYRLGRNLDFNLGYSFQDEEFVDEANDAQSNVTNSGAFGPSLRFETENAGHLLSLVGLYSGRNAVADRFSYQEWSIEPYYFARFKTGTEVYVDLGYLNRDYEAPALLFAALGDREDQRYWATVAVSQRFYKNYFISIGYTYIRNNSNVPLFEYDKMLAGINLGVNFGF